MNLKLTIMGGLAAGSVLLGACYAQPNPPCAVAATFAPYAVFFTLEGTPQGTGCGDLTFDQLGAEKYIAPGTTEATVAVKFSAVGLAIEEGRVDEGDPDATKVYSLGKLPALPTDNICVATDLSPTEQNFSPGEDERNKAALPDGGSITLPDGGVERFSRLPDGGIERETYVLPAYNVKYQFSDLRFSATASALGTVFEGKVAYTLDGCTANYKVDGLWPSHECASDADCLAEADLDAGRAFGSGINPDFVTTCDIPSGHCRLVGTLQSVVQ